MEFKNFTFLLLTVGLIIGPLIFSFEKQIHFFSKLKYLLPAIIFSGVIFIIWDLRFEELGIWSYNQEYITGINILNLPFEKWLFLLVIPYCTIFIYETVKIRLINFEQPNIFLSLSLVLLVVFGLLAYFLRQKLYTFFTFFLLTIYFGYTIFRNRFKKYYTKFYLTYFISLAPFLIVFGILTALPVVQYNSMHILGFRIFSIPVEDFGYFFLLFLMNVTIYEYLKERRFY